MSNMNYLSFALLVVLIGCSDNKNQKEDFIKYLSITHGERSVEDIFGDDVDRVCIQGPYITKKLFSDLVGTDVDEFISDGYSFTFWIFLEDGSIRKFSLSDDDDGINFSIVGAGCIGRNGKILINEIGKEIKEISFID